MNRDQKAPNGALGPYCFYKKAIDIGYLHYIEQ